jgi:ferredoxin
MSVYFLSESGLRDFLDALTQEAEVYGTVEREERLDYEGLDSENIKLVTLDTVRSHTTPKTLLFPVTERVATYSRTGLGEAKTEQPTRVLVGMRQCDLAAIHMLDLVFLQGEYVDPFYKARRDSTILISTDCRDAAASCFCTLIGGKPYPSVYYDINFSPLAEGFIAETGSERGEALVKKHSGFFTTATEEQLRERERDREAQTARLIQQNKEFEPERPIQEVFEGEIDEKKLEKLAWDCVECGACTNICPSCHCFLMFDQPAAVGVESAKTGAAVEGAKAATPAWASDSARKGREIYERLRMWDSCVFGEYARMAGTGGVKLNPRAAFRTRFANRFLHKYLYFYKMFRQFQCSGCGRCFDACLGGIDPRRVIREMSKKDHD